MYKQRSRRELEQTFGRSNHVRKMLAATAQDGAQNAERLAPRLTGGRQIKVTHGVRIGDGGVWEGYVKATGWNWHLPEFGALRWPTRPYLRPGVTTALARRGGQLKET